MGEKKKKVHWVKVSVSKIGHFTSFGAKFQIFTKFALKKGYRTLRWNILHKIDIISKINMFM